jgi:flagellar biosynthesis GTPase FlhF
MRPLGCVVVIVIFSILVAPASAKADKRVALVIGNSAYQHTPKLINPKNDAVDIAAAFKKHGFEVIEGLDLDKVAFDRKVRDFAVALKSADVGIFFYAGHGLQVAGQNYLVPIDAKAEGAEALDFEMVRVDVVHRIMERQTSTNILFLDACRDNPLARNLARSMGTRSADVGRGLAVLESGVGTLISFSTQPGNVALDGTGRNSPFAGSLIKNIATGNEDLSAILISVRNDVMKDTKRKQVPWEHSALTGQFYFSAPKAALDQQMELAFWNTVKDSDEPAVVKTYLERYPEGTFAALARALVAGLEKEAQAHRAAREEEQKRIQAEQKRLEETRKAADLRRLEELNKDKSTEGAEELRQARDELRKARELMEAAEAQRRAAQKTAEEARKEAATATKAIEAEAKQKADVAKPKPKTASSCASRTSGARVFAREPPRGIGALGQYEKAYVNDGACPQGQIKEIVGGMKGVGRQVRCIPC